MIAGAGVGRWKDRGKIANLLTACPSEKSARRVIRTYARVLLCAFSSRSSARIKHETGLRSFSWRLRIYDSDKKKTKSLNNTEISKIVIIFWIYALSIQFDADSFFYESAEMVSVLRSKKSKERQNFLKYIKTSKRQFANYFILTFS